MENFDDILDESLDDILDLPELRAFANGAHKAIITWHPKDHSDEAKKKPVYGLKLKLVETLELADPNPDPEDVIAPGTETYTSYDMNHEVYGAPSFKALVAPLAEHFQTRSVKEILEKSNGMEVVVTTKQRFGKDDKKKEQPYTQVIKLMLI